MWRRPRGANGDTFSPQMTASNTDRWYSITTPFGATYCAGSTPCSTQ